MKMKNNRAYLFWSKWTGSNMEIWVTTYTTKNGLTLEQATTQSEPLEQKKILVVPCTSNCNSEGQLRQAISR